MPFSKTHLSSHRSQHPPSQSHRPGRGSAHPLGTCWTRKHSYLLTAPPSEAGPTIRPLYRWGNQGSEGSLGFPEPQAQILEGGTSPLPARGTQQPRVRAGAAPGGRKVTCSLGLVAPLPRSWLQDPLVGAGVLGEPCWASQRPLNPEHGPVSQNQALWQPTIHPRSLSFPSSASRS